jgi:8-oxo-dGTP diphosphatase
MPQNDKVIHVAAGVVINAQGRILVAKRPKEKHQGGLWEFPGGKIEAGESAHSALVRELEEEIGIGIKSSEPLIRIRHDYPDKRVCLAVLQVNQFSGEAWGREGQEIAWVAPADLPHLEFPAANTPIVAAARLPRQLMITGAFKSEKEFLRLLRQGLENPVGMVQFRAPWLAHGDYLELARKAHEVCRARGIPMLLNCGTDTFRILESEGSCDGLHLTSQALASLGERPIARDLWLSAACHNLEQIKQAEAIGADFISLSPVQPTQSHPQTATLGWNEFSTNAEAASLPAYALGGLGPGDLNQAIAKGAQGVAAIGAYWLEANCGG